jgi:YD repeat-containing protein
MEPFPAKAVSSITPARRRLFFGVSAQSEVHAMKLDGKRQGRLTMRMAMRRTLAGVILLLTMGLASTLRAQSGSPVQYFYDDLRRLVKVVDQNGNVASYQ